MIIQLSDTYRIVPAGKGYELETKHTVEKGEKAGQEYWKFCGYYPNLNFITTALVKKHLDGVNVTIVNQVNDEIKNAAQALYEKIEVLIEQQRRNDI